MKLHELFTVVKDKEAFSGCGVLTETEMADLLLTEGLIRSADRKQLFARIGTAFPKKIKIIRNPQSKYQVGLQWKKLTPEEEKKLERLLGVLGWFRSKNQTDGTSTFTQIEPKYDMLEQDLPRYLFHVTPLTNVDKIMKLGLAPVTKHPERVYLAKNEADADNITSQLSKLDNQSYAHFRIDTSKLLRTTKFYWDTNFMSSSGSPLGLYTMSNIPPVALELIST
jgi:hypothetical protein